MPGSKLSSALATLNAGTHPDIAEHGQRNFAQSSYVNAQGKQQPMYRMTAKGMAELNAGWFAR